MHPYGDRDEGIRCCFIRAPLYLHPTGAEALREPQWRARFPWTERHLQCVWFDPRLRPKWLPTSSGERVVVESPGIWNLEEGPDFLGGVVRVEPGRRRLAGDVEVHIAPEDWLAHGHEQDPRYARVRIHVSFFPGSGGPPGALQIVLHDSLKQHLGGDLGCIDVTAYPYAVRGAPAPCAEPVATWSAERIEAFLNAAGEERLRRKAERIRLHMETAGAEQAFYVETLAALGYKHNKVPCRRLAEVVPVDVLREESGGDPSRAFALLAGVANLLPAPDSVRWDAQTRSQLRVWWDYWWRRRDAFADKIIAREAWKMGGLRPANHPVRRLMAAALFFTAEPDMAYFWRQAAKGAPRRVVEQFVQAWLGLRDPYFSWRYVPGGKPLARAVSLLGRERAEALAVNVFVPFLAAAEAKEAFTGGLLDALPMGEENAIIRRMAHTLLGRDCPPSLYRAGLRRQGLLQVFHDYCVNDRSRCAACPLPSLLARAGHER